MHPLSKDHQTPTICRTCDKGWVFGMAVPAQEDQQVKAEQLRPAGSGAGGQGGRIQGVEEFQAEALSLKFKDQVTHKHRQWGGESPRLGGNRVVGDKGEKGGHM